MRPRWLCRLTLRHRGHVVSVRLGKVVWMCDNCGAGGRVTPRERYEAACAALLYVTKAAWVRWEDTTIDCRLTWGASE